MAISMSAVLARPSVRVSGNLRSQIWTPDTAAVEAACVTLGVARDVTIYHAEYRRGRWAGSHKVSAQGHVITLAWWLTREAASKVLWHELTHAAQHERGDETGTMRIAREQGHDAYMNHPAEVEARANEAFAARCPLVLGW